MTLPAGECGQQADSDDIVPGRRQAGQLIQIESRTNRRKVCEIDGIQDHLNRYQVSAHLAKIVGNALRVGHDPRAHPPILSQ